MRLTLACLADAATVSPDGKINMLGVFNRIWGQRFPVSHPHMAYVARLEFEATDDRQHRIGLRLVNEDGHLVVTIPEGTVNLPRNPEGEVIVTPFVMGINDALFVSPGTYTFELMVDGVRTGETFLYVRQRPQPAS